MNHPASREALLPRTRYVLLSVIVAVTVGCLLVLLQTKPAATATIMRSGFEDQLVAKLGAPIALASTPDGRMLIAQQHGKVRIFQNEALNPTPAIDLSGTICNNVERGLLGVAVDPDFSTNGYVYLYYTFNQFGNEFGSCPEYDVTNPKNPVNRVSRFVMVGNTIDKATEKVLIDNIPSFGRHNAGDLRFGKDGLLYASVGDAGCDYANDSGCQGQNDASRDPHVLLGKVLRVTRDGAIPAGNPYTGTDSARCNLAGRTDPGKKCQETFAMGLRNPFRMDVDPDASGTRLFVNDVGGDAWEEVDEARAGADYGWNVCEGLHDNPFRSGSADCATAYAPPVHEYAHADTGCASATGAAFVPDGVWPAEYDNSYLVGDYVCNKIFELKPKMIGGYAMSEFASALGQGGPIAMDFLPTGGGGTALYYTTYANDGELHRIVHDGSEQEPNVAPVADVVADPNYSLPPDLTISFDGSGSADPDGDEPLVYLWDFGDGTKAETTTPTTSHAYPTGNKKYTARLSVRDARGMVSSVADTVAVFPGNTPPEPKITSPVPDRLFKAGEYLQFEGSATDAEDGTLGDSRLKWEVIQHHNGDHTHPYKTGSGNNITVKMPPPENILSTDPAKNYLEMRLIATDSKGLSKTVTQIQRPKTVEVTFGSQPSGLPLEANGLRFDAPRTFVSWYGYKLNVSAEPSAVVGTTTYTFHSWSNGKLPQHTITTGSTPTTYRVDYRACTIVGTPGNDVLKGTEADDTICGMEGDDVIYGYGGKDYLAGVNGNDELWGGIKGDWLYGNAGDDKLYGEAGPDSHKAKDGVAGNDYLDGGIDTDTDYKSTDATEASIINIP